MTIVKNILPSNPNESNGSRIEISARSKFAKSSCCITYAHCQLSQQCALTVARILDTLTEPGSLWSMSPLSSPCRMGTAPGFLPWKLVIPHCGKPCLAVNFPINNFSQHLFARARNCRGWCHDAYSDMGRCYQLVATLTLRGNTHTQIIPNPSQSSKHLISHDNCKKTSCLRISMSQMEAELKLPLVQNSQSRGYAALTHAANCASNVCGQMADFLIPWLNLVRWGPCLLCLPRAGWKQFLDFHHGN